MPTATFNGATIAQGEAHVVEGSSYFKPELVDQKSLSKSSTTTVCPWKGAACLPACLPGLQASNCFGAVQAHSGVACLQALLTTIQ